MKQLYAPWRSSYSSSVAHSSEQPHDKNDCVFCTKFAQNKDEEFFILCRYQHHAILLNLFPYNAGHLLIIPFAHLSEPSSLSLEAQHEMIELIAHAQHIMKAALEAHGCNIGINIGKAAGAGIPAHLHTHVLPRWFGDTNFLPIFGETKQISFDLTEIYRRLKPHFKE